jgi:hypothetical protein
MSGCFSLIDDHANPYHVPPERFVESHPCLSAAALHREGLMVENASAAVQIAGKPCRLDNHDGQIFIDGFRVRLATHPVLRWRVFLCPVCSGLRYKLLCVEKQWACFRCHHLSHRSRHRERTIPNWHKLARLRRKISADPRPFTPIAPRPPRQRKYWKIVHQIREIEAGLVRHG